MLQLQSSVASTAGNITNMANQDTAAAAAAIKAHNTHVNNGSNVVGLTNPYSHPSVHPYLSNTNDKIQADLRRAAATAAATARGIEQDDDEDDDDLEEEEEDEKAVAATGGSRLAYDNPYFSHYSAAVGGSRVIPGNPAAPVSITGGSAHSGQYPPMSYGSDVTFGNHVSNSGPVSYQSLEARNHALFIMTNGNARVDRYGNFHCLLCFKKFTRNSNLRRHLRIHEAVKRFKCSHCSKRFMEKHHLDAHERIHSGARPFQCPACFRSFADRSNCSRHIKTHGNGYQMPIVVLDHEVMHDREYHSRENTNDDQIAAAAHLQAVSQRPHEGVRIRSTRNGAVAEEQEPDEYDDDGEEEVHEEEEEDAVPHGASAYASAARQAGHHQARSNRHPSTSTGRDNGEETDDDNAGQAGYTNGHGSNHQASRRYATTQASVATSFIQPTERHYSSTNSTRQLTHSSSSSSHHFRSADAAAADSTSAAAVIAKVEPSTPSLNTATPSPQSSAPVVPVNSNVRGHSTTLFNTATTRLSPSMPPLQPVTASAAADSNEIVSPSGRRQLTSRGVVDMSLDGPMQQALKAAQAAKGDFDASKASAPGNSNVSEASSSSGSSPSPTTGQSSSQMYGRYAIPGPKLHVPVRAKRPLDGEKRGDDEDDEEEDYQNRKRRRSKLNPTQLTPPLQSQAQAAAVAQAAANGSAAIFSGVSPANFLSSFLPGGANFHPLTAQNFYQNPAGSTTSVAPTAVAPAAAPAPAPSVYPQPYSPFNFLQQSPPQPPPVIPPPPPAMQTQPTAVYQNPTVAYNPFGYALPPLPAIPPMPNPAHHPVSLFPPSAAADMVAAQQHAIAQQHANAAYAATIRQLQLTGR